MIVGIVVGVILFFALVGLISYLVDERKDRHGEKDTVRGSSPQLSYSSEDSIMTKRELFFYHRLISICKKYRLSVCPKVRLADLFSVERLSETSRKQWWNQFSKISQKHVDYLLLRYDGSVVCGIELDDISHDRESVREADRFKDWLFFQSGIPLVRFRDDLSEEHVADVLRSVLR